MTKFVKKTDKDMVKIPIITYDELMELAGIMGSSNYNELEEIKFWEEVYERRGLKYIRKRGCHNEN